MIGRTIASVESWTFEGWTAPAAAALEFWVSFWPAAPLFGVEWRFADWAGGYAPFAGPAAGRPKTTDRPAKAAAKLATAGAKRAEVPEPAAVNAAPEKVAGTQGAAPKNDPAKPADDLKLIKGIGAGLEKQLNALGIRHFSQLAALSDKELAALDEKLTTIKGRCFRDDWVGQAKALAV